ncbi:DUF2505 domain-containing protein [Isoptericola jiangsuensis]|uniref:DUF2505 domain-containing protein n=1 Tax=Isoptericola jiangsuensis TaxID=548579 RepID=UPI003AAFFAA2
MHLTVELSYAADVPAVAAMLCDPEFVAWRAARPGATRATRADVSGDVASGFTLSVRRTLPTDVIPHQLRAVVGDHLEVRQAEAWEPADGARHVGTVAVEITGAPVRLTGTLRLEPAPDGGTRHTYDVDVRASVPLFAVPVEEAAARAVRRTLEAEQQAAWEWLTRE